MVKLKFDSILGTIRESDEFSGSVFVDSLWSESGNDIYYNTGSVSVGTATPVSTFTVAGDILATGSVEADVGSFVELFTSGSTLTIGGIQVKTASGSELVLGSENNATITAPFFAGDGSKLFNLDIGSELDLTDLADISISSPADGEFLVYNATGSVWENQAVEAETEFEANCTASEQVGDAVYILSDNEVRKADASSITTSQVVGFIREKPSTTTCVISTIGEFGALAGLTAGATYFLSEISGGVTASPPTTSGAVVLPLGKALTSTRFIINLSSIPSIRA